MNLSSFLAKRLYSSQRRNRSAASRPAVAIAIVGVAAGLAVMIVSVSIALGFKHEISSKVIGFGSHILVTDASSTLEQAASPVNLSPQLESKIRSAEGVRHMQAFSIKPGILKTDSSFAGITLKGIGQGYDTSFLQKHIVSGSMPDFTKPSEAGDIVISQSIAVVLKLKAGSRIFAYFFEDGLRTRRFRVAAIYSTNLSQFDDVLVFASLPVVSQLCGYGQSQVSGIEITVNDFSRLKQISTNVSKALSYFNIYNNTQYVSYNIRETYPQIFDWLDLLDTNIIVILMLMLLVAGVTIVSGLLILILEHTSTIALLKSLGAQGSLVRVTFVKLSLIILSRGMLWGNVIGLSVCAVQRFTKIVSLDPSKYYLDSVPVEFNIMALLFLNAAVLVVSTLALVLPSSLAAKVHPSRVLRFE